MSQNLETLKKRLAVIRAACARCDEWVCGYCGVRKFNIEAAIIHLENKLGVENERQPA